METGAERGNCPLISKRIHLTLQRPQTSGQVGTRPRPQPPHKTGWFSHQSTVLLHILSLPLLLPLPLPPFHYHTSCCLSDCCPSESLSVHGCHRIPLFFLLFTPSLQHLTLVILSSISRTISVYEIFLSLGLPSCPFFLHFVPKYLITSV